MSPPLPKLLFIGQKYSLSTRFSQQHVTQFSKLSGDHNSIHLLSCHESSVLKAKYPSNPKPIVHGMLASSLFSAIGGQHFPGQGSIYVKQNLNFHRPIFVDDLISAEITLISSKKSYFNCKTVIQNNSTSEIAISGDAVLMHPEARAVYSPSDIFSYWFNRIVDLYKLANPNSQYSPSAVEIWFAPDEKMDLLLKDMFQETVHVLSSVDESLRSQWLNYQNEDPIISHLAIIILFDQLSRNIWRGKPQAFSMDQISLSYAEHAINELGALESTVLTPIQKSFLLMPFEHSENLSHQSYCVEKFRALCETCNDENKPILQEFLKYAIAHHDVIEQFGRFPHRNKILDRESTPEELDYLSKGHGF